MFYFIPAWYSSEKKWGDITSKWYHASSDSGFDDTINYMRMFQEAGEDCSLIILNYMPNLRYYTHRFDLFEVPRWSLFDHLQGITSVVFQPIDYRTLNWPDQVEFIYTPFLMIAQVAGELLAHIHFGDEGQLIWIDYFSNHQIEKRYIFDDRAFLSSIICYTNQGEAWYQIYFNELGQWRFKEYLLYNDQHIEVNPAFEQHFSKLWYVNMTDLIREKLEEYREQVLTSQDTVMIASEERHNSLLLDKSFPGKVVLSYFEHRNREMELSRFTTESSACHLMLVDSRSMKHMVESSVEQSILHIPLFDTRLSLGTSQRHKENYLYFLIDGLAWQEIREISSVIFDRMREDKTVHLIYVSYENNDGLRQQIESSIKNILENEDEPYLSLIEEIQPVMFEFGDEDDIRVEPTRVALEFPRTELEIMRVLNPVRLVIDLSDNPHLYTQIASISSGIPQINKVETEFLEHQKTGYLLEKTSDLATALEYYLNGMTNWNENLVHIVRKIGEYTSGQLVERIKAEL